MFTTKACIDSQKKLVEWQYLLYRSLQYAELWPANDYDPSKFQQVPRLGFVTAATSLNRGQRNCTMFGRLLDWYTIYALLLVRGVGAFKFLKNRQKPLN